MQPSMAFQSLPHSHSAQAQQPQQVVAHSTGTHAHPLDPHPQQQQQQQQHQSQSQASVAPYTLFSPQYMDSAATPSSQNINPGVSRSTTSPTASTIMNSLATAGMPSPALRKKPGRGPGKKDAKDRPAVSVRWEDGDLTERLIHALETNERWAGVFVQSSPEQGQPRVSIGVPKRDLQRELARHLFQADPRYDVNDRKTLEALAVSIKNKLFKITTLYNECKTELGYASTLKNESEIPQGSEHAATWARVKEKCPQFYRIRDMINRLGPGTPHQEESATPVLGEPSLDSRSRATTATSANNPSSMSVPLPTNNTSSSLRGAVDMPPEAAPYVDVPMHQRPPHSGIQSSYLQVQPSNASTISTTGTVTSPPYSIHSPQLQTHTNATYPQPQHSRRLAPRLQLNVPGSGPSARSSVPPGLASTSHILHAPQPQAYTSTPLTQSSQPAPSPYQRSQIPMSNIPTSANPPDTLSPSPTPGPPSPPLSSTIQQILATLTSRKDKERARHHELEMMRLRREEADRQRWHEREMMRLRIQLIRAERAAAGIATSDAMSTTSTARSTVGPFPGRRESLPAHAHYGGGPTEDELALAGDEMSVEGDGEGEVDDTMTSDPDPSTTGYPHSHSIQNTSMRPPPPPGSHHQ